MAERFFRDFLAAVLAGSHRDARAVVADARRAGLGLDDLYLRVFQPTLREVGRLWQENRINVADEHLATAITQALMGQLAGAQPAATGRAPRSVVAACVDVERHEVGLRMICDLLEQRGWEAVYLGANVPADALVNMVRDRRPVVVALSISLAPHLPRLRQTIGALRAELGERTPLVMVGGRPFLEDPTLAGQVGADLTALDAAEAVARLEERFPG